MKDSQEKPNEKTLKENNFASEEEKKYISTDKGDENSQKEGAKSGFIIRQEQDSSSSKILAENVQTIKEQKSNSQTPDSNLKSNLVLTSLIT